MDFIISISAIIVAVIIGVLQLKQSKNNEYRSCRNEILQACMDFQRNAIHRYSEIMRYYHDNNLRLLENIQIHLIYGKNPRPETQEKENQIFIEKVMHLFNEMDSFATIILNNPSQIIDLAREIQGNAFCDIINQLKCVYDLFMIKNSSDYTYLTKLYEKWNKSEQIHTSHNDRHRDIFVAPIVINENEPIKKEKNRWRFLSDIRN